MKTFNDELSLRFESRECFPFEELNFLEEEKLILERFTCPICFSLIMDPVICKCDPPHMYGKKCLLESLKNKSECPLSRQPLDSKTLSSASFEALNQLGLIKVKCENCEWKDRLSLFKFHLKDCGYVIIPCPFFGRYCQEKIYKKDLKKHFKDNLKKHIDSAKIIFRLDDLNLLFDIIQEKIDMGDNNDKK